MRANTFVLLSILLILSALFVYGLYTLQQERECVDSAYDLGSPTTVWDSTSQTVNTGSLVTTATEPSRVLYYEIVPSLPSSAGPMIRIETNFPLRDGALSLTGEGEAINKAEGVEFCVLNRYKGFIQAGRAFDPEAVLENIIEDLHSIEPLDSSELPKRQ